MPVSIYILTILSVIMIICCVYILAFISPREATKLSNYYIAFRDKVCIVLENIIGKNALLTRYSMNIQERLVKAGLEPLLSQYHFIFIRLIISFLVLLLVLLLHVLFHPKGLLNNFLVLILLAGFNVAPDIWLHRRIQRWRNDFAQSFPFMLDLLVLTVRSGLTLTSAIDHAIKKLAPGPVKYEFSKLLLDIRTGMSRKEALNAMSSRLSLRSVTSFVAVVNQLEITGGEIGSVLSIQAKHKRTERFLCAEKLANQAPVKLLLPLIGLLFPVTMLLIMLPVYLRVSESGVFNTLF